MERRFVSVDPVKCIGCGVCEYVCAFEKEKSFNPLRSRIRVVRFHQVFNAAMVCRFCEDPPCVTACPREALKQSRENGVILVDESLCDACGWCIIPCPHGAIMMDPEKRVVMMCDLCGGHPECVDFCPEEALDLATEDKGIQWASSIKRAASNAEKVLEGVRKGEWETLFMETDSKMRRLELKLSDLFDREAEAG